MNQEERVATRERDREPDSESYYESVMTLMRLRRELAQSGRIVIKASEVKWESNRQGKIGYYLHEKVDDTALRDWRMFTHEIQTHSGTHRHQGGLVLYVTKGRGYTVVDGKAAHWGEGDLILLPVQPGGCEHQHFNEDPDEPSEWVAFVYVPLQFATGALFEQVRDSPNWKG